MKLNPSGSKNRISRREFLKGIRPKGDGSPIIDKEKCTGCGLCVADCPTGALTILEREKEDSYQIIFTQDLCNSCANCEKGCPEKCLHLERGLEPDKIGKAAKVIFKDNVSRCSGCGVVLFPQAMLNHLRLRVSAGIGDLSWPFDLCPTCRMKTQFERKTVGKSKA